MVSAAASRAFNQALAQHRAAALCAMRFRTSLGQRCTGENKASMGSRTLQCLCWVSAAASAVLSSQQTPRDSNVSTETACWMGY